jgi:DNA repair exonuclease SbcCD ATPase subunit
LLSSKNDAKQENRFVARLDVLVERVDTLASTVATTASAIAKKDGEIVALQRAIEARDQTLQELVQHVNRTAESAAAADVPVDATELRSLRNAVAALTKERAGGVNAAQIQSLVAAVRALDERTGALSAAAAAPPVPTTDPATTARIEALAAELAAVRTALDRTPADLVTTLSTLRDRVDGLTEAGSVTEKQLDQRLGATSDALATQSERLDALGRMLEEHNRKRAVDEAQVNRRLGETGEALDRVSHRLETLGTQSPRIDAIAERVEDLERRRDAKEDQVDRRIRSSDDALAKVSQRLEVLAEALSSLETAQVVHEERLDHRFGKTSDALTTLTQRLDDLRSIDEERLDRRLGETEDALATLARRLDVLGETLGQRDRTRAVQDEQLIHRVETTSDALVTLSRRLDALQSVDEAHLNRRLEAMDDALATLAERHDTLGATIESAAAGLGDKERELATLQRHFTESSTRIESIVDDIREALHAFPELSSTSIDDLAARLERIETATRKATETSARAAGELSGRIDAIDQRVATVADEVSRAKTLWPVALRSLEARLDDAVHARRHEAETTDTHAPGAPADDLLAGLRDSLQAMETVAAEMARASETLSPQPDEPEAKGHHDAPTAETDAAETPAEEPAAEEPQSVEQPPAAASAGGATVVPLRSGEP